MVDEYVEWKLSIVKTASALAVLDACVVVGVLVCAYGLWHLRRVSEL